MARINIDFSQYDNAVHEAAMERLMAAGEAIRDEAKRILSAKLKGNWKPHGVYKSYYKNGKRIMYEGDSWTAREKGAMVDTIRATRSKNKKIKNIYVIAGNYNTWWATQLEFGNGGWHGGARSFMRPALHGANSRVIGILEGGAIESTEVIR